MDNDGNQPLWLLEGGHLENRPPVLRVMISDSLDDAGEFFHNARTLADSLQLH